MAELRNSSFITEDSFCVSKLKHICLLIMVQLTAMLGGKKSRPLRQEQDVYLVTQRREAHMSAAGISHQRIIFWAAVIAAGTLRLFPVSPHPKKGVCLRAIEQTAVCLQRTGALCARTSVQVFCMLHAIRKV